MSKSENLSDTAKEQENLDSATARHILQQTAEDIPPAHPALFARIEESIKEPTPVGNAHQPPSVSPVQALLNMIRNSFRRPQLAWGIVAVQAIVLCLFIASAPIKNTYHTLSANRTDIGAQAGPIFYVIFHENARLREIEQLLARTNGAIINGPGKRGIYTIRFHPTPSATVKKLLTTLKNSSLITFIERAY
ncbi:MAG TPA: hypothetical protein ENJ30_12720 [Desulfobulbaceae bacterium]|nr:hypothetical protein [Desulfobulbaceae bacterium]